MAALAEIRDLNISSSGRPSLKNINLDITLLRNNLICGEIVVLYNQI